MDSMRVVFAVMLLVLFAAALPASCEESQPVQAVRLDVRADITLASR